LPRHDTDPFDRVLVAHALHADLGVLTRDRVFASYGVRLAA
jgi:PIN domain nuclease of toxin-antitoxin system